MNKPREFYIGETSTGVRKVYEHHPKDDVIVFYNLENMLHVREVVPGSEAQPSIDWSKVWPKTNFHYKPEERKEIQDLVEKALRGELE